jgi:L-asparagine transporter-like permease
MKDFIEKILLRESFELNSSILELKEQIRSKKERKFNLDWISDNEFKFLSKVSIGTIMLNYNPGYFDGIKGYAVLTELNNGNTKIELSTKLRFEMYFLGILFIVFLLLFLFNKENLPIWTLFLFPVMIIWFWFVYRFQEKRLFEKVKKYLKTELKT